MLMKKKIFGLLAILLVLVPIHVNAADGISYTVFGSEDQAMTKTTLNGAITCPKSADRKTATCYIGVKVNSGTVKSFKVEGTLKNLKYDSYEDLNGLTMKSPTISGKNITYEFSSRTGVTGGNKVVVVGVTYLVENPAEECSLEIKTSTPTNPDTPQGCRVENNKYYCENGVECSKAEYDEKCVPNNPQTGSFVPYVIVLGGLGVAGALYFTTRKKAKIYHV